MIENSRVNELVQSWISQRSGFFIVGITINPLNAILVEIDGFSGVTIEDCVSLHETIESALDREIEDYELEVGSAGLGQPFKVFEQYIKHVGDEVEVLASSGIKVAGILVSADNSGFFLKVKRKIKVEGSKRAIEKEEDVHYGYDEIKYTKYLIRFK
ncbi:MAG: ribosome assembly cofactor RimP [Bacteroidales bacterium]|nr:ribosome assembly cofactor RimP [Bacteroidales bacterium]MDD4822643.1 ribosome assembly cofactor RimP [Bacteroidales bacterium]